MEQVFEKKLGQQQILEQKEGMLKDIVVKKALLKELKAKSAHVLCRVIRAVSIFVKKSKMQDKGFFKLAVEVR